MQLPPANLVQRQITYAEAIFSRWKVDYADMLRRAKHDSRDGYPTTSLGGGGGSKGTHSDPVGDIATSGPSGDPVRASVDRALNYWFEILDLFQALDSARAKAQPLEPAERPEIPAEAVRGNCINCDIVVYAHEQFRASRCAACYQYRLRHDGSERHGEADVA